MKGIINFANNCFLNSVVQVLSHIDDFVDALVAAKSNEISHQHWPVASSKSSLLSRSRTGGRGYEALQRQEFGE